MNRIIKLDENTTNKIAAGEVVERPFSVVKELVENSIDANSKNITIEIENGGESLIKITDDGIGIHPSDMLLAFLPHATSKIKTIEDIYKISTMGFRGEALASIASISKLKITSRIENSDCGRKLVFCKGEIEEDTEIGCSKGTIIEVRDLFFNVPARLKFLKTPQREASLISDIITRLALANPQISFRFINNGKTVFSTYGNGNLKDAIRVLYGKEVYNNIVEFEGVGDTMSVYGFIGTAEISRGSRNRQSIFVNKRFIKNKLITTAVENAFKSFLTVNKFPYFTIFIEIYPELIDVNVHPTKSEIKFQDDRVLFKIIFDAVHKSLSNKIKNQFNEELEENETKSVDIYQPSYLKEENKVDIMEDKSSLSLKDKSLGSNIETIKSYNDQFISSIPLDLKNDTISQEYAEIESEVTSTTHNSLNDIKDNSEFRNYEYNNISSTNNVAIGENLETTTSYEESSNSQKNEEFIEKVAKFPELNIIGQYNSTYIIAEAFNNLYLIDQHAAHEKVLFENYREEVKNRKVICQILLTPVIIELSLDDFSLYTENFEIFKEAGFTVETFGENTISIREVPLVLGNFQCKDLFMDILDNLKAMGSGKAEDVKYDKIATIACKAAIKANKRLSIDEMNFLVNNKLRYINEPFTCPHGRPTIIKFTLYDIEKRFKRIQ